MTSSPRASICRAKSSASGENASGGIGCRASRSCLGAGGRPAFPPRVVVAVKALACEWPAQRGVPLAHWSLSDLQQAVVAQGLVAQISGATLWRWLSQDALRPWRHRSWIFPRDPAFAPKAERILDLYAGRWDGVALGPREYVLSADEKTSIQARLRLHPSLAPAAGRPMYLEHEYERGGAWAYLAAWDVHRAKVFGRCEPTTGIAPFDRLVAQVMTQEPYRSARRVFWVVDNGSSHRGERARARLRARWPRLVLVHTPVHASWLNQIEIYFSIVQRKVLTPNDFASLADVEDRLLRFQDHYEQAATPFEWTFTRQDLAALLVKLAAKDRWAAAA
jgi:DDE superfamily endonuclease